MNDPSKVQASWDSVYIPGSKYQNEPPLPFTNLILETLNKEHLLKGKGLYIGCGNGRNYIPLTQNGLDLIGLDISSVALKQISDKFPNLKDKLIHSSFSEYKSLQLFDYIIAIQVFQHGNYDEVMNNFRKVSSLLKPGGLFFFRNRSTDSPTVEKYEIIEKTDLGGFTVKYLSGSKKDLEIHFLSEGEVNQLPKHSLKPIIPPYKVKTERRPPKSGTMVHWEGIWRKED
jgi:SAM-dependent methyltransferase